MISADLEFRSALEFLPARRSRRRRAAPESDGASRAAPRRRAQSARRPARQSETLRRGRAVSARGDEDFPGLRRDALQPRAGAPEPRPTARRARRLRQGAGQGSSQRRRLVRSRQRAAGGRQGERGDRLLRPRVGDRPQLSSRPRQQRRGAVAPAAVFRSAAHKRGLPAPRAEFRPRASQQGGGALQSRAVRPRARLRRRGDDARSQCRQRLGDASQYLPRARPSRRGDRQHRQGAGA